MARFYGVYVNSTGISTVLDIIRFLGQPDNIRFSHITLQGPYKEPGLSQVRLQEVNDRYQDVRTVEMVEPANFFSDRQSTVVITVDLGILKELFYKPDFPDGTPHLTLYDGNDREFAQSVFAISRQYGWGFPVEVGPLRAIESKPRLDSESLPLFSSFCSVFGRLVGDPGRITSIKDLSVSRRLDLIHSVFEQCVQKPLAKPRPAGQITRHEYA